MQKYFKIFFFVLKYVNKSNKITFLKEVIALFDFSIQVLELH